MGAWNSLQSGLKISKFRSFWDFYPGPCLMAYVDINPVTGFQNDCTRTCGPKIVGNEPQRHQTKDYKIGICCFSAKHTTLRRKSKDGLARNQDNMTFMWGNMSIRGLLFQ